MEYSGNLQPNPNILQLSSSNIYQDGTSYSILFVFIFAGGGGLELDIALGLEFELAHFTEWNWNKMEELSVLYSLHSTCQTHTIEK